ncbi:hypothetical protein QRL03_002729 [Escherichia coli]|nr:hypothetical protein [Escherichia coli]
MMKQRDNPQELDNLVCNYFGHDYDLIDDSEALQPKIDAYNRQAGKAMQMALLEDIDDFLALGDTMNMAFSKRYGVYFDPLLWGITPHDFLVLVREQVNIALANSQNN